MHTGLCPALGSLVRCYGEVAWRSPELLPTTPPTTPFGPIVVCVPTVLHDHLVHMFDATMHETLRRLALPIHVPPRFRPGFEAALASLEDDKHAGSLKSRGFVCIARLT